MHYLLLALLFCATTLQANDSVVATVNKLSITAEDLSEALEDIPLVERRANDIKKVKSDVLQNLIADTVVLSAAKKAGVEETKIYQRAVKQESERIARQLFVEQSIKGKISEQALQKAYAKKYPANKDYTEINARHILLETVEGADKLIAQLNTYKGDALEEFFAELAKKHSIGPSGQEGGKLGWFDKKTMVPPFTEAAFQLKENSFTTTPVKTRFGYHVIYVAEKRNGTPPAFKSVKATLRQEIAQTSIYELLKQLQADAVIDINDTAFEKVKVAN